MKKVMVLAALAVGLCGLGASRTAAAQDPPSNTVSIHGFTFGGNGCPDRSVGANITSDAKTLTLVFDKFVANGGGSGADAHKDCTVIVDLNFPQGWSFSIATADYAGFAHLDASVRGTQRSRYWFFGAMPKFESTLVGPFHDDYFRRDTLGLEAVVWSACGAIEPLHIKSSVDILPPTASGSTMSVTSTDLRVKQIFGLQWRKCP